MSSKRHCQAEFLYIEDGLLSKNKQEANKKEQKKISVGDGISQFNYGVAWSISNHYAFVTELSDDIFMKVKPFPMRVPRMKSLEITLNASLLT